MQTETKYNRKYQIQEKIPNTRKNINNYKRKYQQIPGDKDGKRKATRRADTE